jgi:hypothetical protein
MSLVTFEEARPWAASIRKEILAKRMPPFHADGPLGYYKDDIRLAPAELETLVTWIDSGTPRGELADAPAPKTWTSPAWPLGQPDLLIKFPEVTPRADNLDDYWTLYSDYVFPEDMWVRGTQLHLDPDSNVHHAHWMLLEAGAEIPEERVTAGKVDPRMHQPIETWFPGLRTSLLPDGLADMFGKGSRLCLQIHFGPNTDGKTERPEVGVYFADGKIDRSPAILGGAAIPIDIPPYEANYTLHTKNTFQVSGTITHFRNHMHLRGKSAQIRLQYPDGTTETVFDLPQFNFDWQRYYFLAEPKWVPAGTVAEYIGTWDNSADNPHNPDPSQRVYIGGRTSDEMFGTKLFYLPDLKLHKTFLVEDGRVVDSYDNPSEGPWVVFWNRVMDRKIIDDALARNAAASQSPETADH